MIFLRIQAPGMGFPLGKGEGDGAEAALTEVVGICHGFSLTASFGIPLPSFSTSNIQCSCTKPQPGTAVIVVLLVSCMPAPSASHPVTLWLGPPCSWGGNLAPQQPRAVLGQGEDSSGLTAPWVTWLNCSCSCCFSCPKQN